MEPTDTLPPIAEQIEQYLETKFRLIKYEVVDSASAIIAEIIVDIVIVFALLITFIFLSITLGLFAAHLLHSAWQGFGCVTILYAIVAVSARLLEVPLQNIFIKKLIGKLFKERNT